MTLVKICQSICDFFDELLKGLGPIYSQLHRYYDAKTASEGRALQEELVTSLGRLLPAGLTVLGAHLKSELGLDIFADQSDASTSVESGNPKQFSIHLLIAIVQESFLLAAGRTEFDPRIKQMIND